MAFALCDRGIIHSADLRTADHFLRRATGKDFACGVCSDSDLIFDGADIQAKTTGKNGRAYAVKDADDVEIRNGSELTGIINAASVSIESGSGLTGSMEGVGSAEFVLNDLAQAKNALWNITGDFAGKIALDINFENEDLLGEFVVAQNRSDAEFSDIFDMNRQVCNIDLIVNDVAYDMKYSGAMDAFTCVVDRNLYTLKEEGKKLIFCAELN